MRSRTAGRSPALLLERAVRDFLEREQRAGKAAATLRCYQADLQGLVRQAGRRVAREQLEAVVRRHLGTLDVAGSSWNRHFSTLRRFCDGLVAGGVLGHNPLGTMTRRPRETTSLSAPRRIEVDRLLQRIERPRDRALIALVADGGLRIGEALQLRLQDIDLGGRSLLISGLRQARRVPLSRPAVVDLRRYLRERTWEPGAPLFVAYRGRPLSYAAAHRLLRAYAGHDGLTMRRLRAAAAVSAFDGGATLRDVQNMLGHLHRTSTVRYQEERENDIAGLRAGQKPTKHNKKESKKR